MKYEIRVLLTVRTFIILRFRFENRVFRDYAQGAFRMRGIGKGQTIKLLVVPEIADRINTQVRIGAGLPMVKSNDPIPVAPQDIRQFLKDVVSWLVINSMRVDGVQYNLLCEQSVANIWRKRSFNTLKTEYKNIDRTDQQLSMQLNRALQIFRERIDYDIENSIPQTLRYSEKIEKLIAAHRDLLTMEADRWAVL